MPAVRSRLVRLLKIGAVVAIALVLVKRIRGTTPPAAKGQANWLPLVDTPPSEQRQGPVQFTSAPTPPAEEKPGSATAAEPVADAAPAEQTWVEPVDGACPATHPIKGNADSGIFHVPGGMSYERTVPERCYATEDDAVADGFRRAKR
jgi:hypothetical protein